MKPILANIGFIFQIAGMLLTIPIVVAFYYNETSALIAFFITSFFFFIVGFLLNALCERKALDFKSSCVLATSVFFLLGLVGTIPYFYLNVCPGGTLIDKFTNAYFEVLSGQTTTGYSFIEDVDVLPRSMTLYRGMSQWIGGMGITFIFLTFLYPEKSLIGIGKFMGIDSYNLRIKRTFLSILAIQAFYICVFFLAFYFLGNLTDIINVLSVVTSSVAAGGAEPVKNFAGMMTYPNNLILSILMILGAISFSIHLDVFSGKLGRALKAELFIFIFIIAGASSLLIFSGWDVFSSLFHVASASSSAGYNLFDLSNLGEPIKLLFILLMFIGGCSLCPAGGVKVARVMMLFKSIPWIIKRSITNRDEKFFFDGREVGITDFLVHMALILLVVIIVIISSIIFTLHGFPFLNSVFESLSALMNVGLPLGIITVSLPIYLKWMIILLMVVGRIEVIPILVVFSRAKPAEEEPKPQPPSPAQDYTERRRVHTIPRQRYYIRY